MKTNQTNLFKYIAGLNLLVAPLALAQTGDRGGNGGDVLVCKDGSVRMLDSVETAGKRPTSYPLSLGGSTLSVREKVKIAINRVQAKDGLIAIELNNRTNLLLDDVENYEANHNVLQVNTEFTTDELVNIPDEGMAKIPAGCEIKQLIVQTANPLPGRKTFTFQSDLWKRMNSDQRAAAITHEAIYSYLISKNAASSPVTRFYNGLIISNEMNEMSVGTYFQTVDELKFPSKVLKEDGRQYPVALVNGYLINTNLMSFAKDGTLRIASCYSFEMGECLHLQAKLSKFMKLNSWYRDPLFLYFNQGKLVSIDIKAELRSDQLSELGRNSYSGPIAKEIKDEQIPIFIDPTLTFSQDGRTVRVIGSIKKFFRPKLGEIKGKIEGKAKGVYDTETGQQISFEIIP